ADKITASAVAIGADADLELMQHVARWGGGRSYATRDLYSIPQILTAEALIASRAYLVEERFAPQIVRTGLVDDFTVPALRGYVATAPKPASAVHLASAQDDPVLATWQFGIGRAVAFTSDATARDASGRTRIRTAGFVVPYSPELRDLTVNRALLAQVTETTGGRLLDDPAAAVAPARESRSAADSWPVFAGAALGAFVVEIA